MPKRRREKEREDGEEGACNIARKRYKSINATDNAARGTWDADRGEDDNPAREARTT